MVSASVANDFFRRQNSAKRGGKVVTYAAGRRWGAVARGHMQPAARMRQSALLAQLDRKLRSAPEGWRSDRRLLLALYRQGFTAEEIAGLAAPD